MDQKISFKGRNFKVKIFVTNHQAESEAVMAGLQSIATNVPENSSESDYRNQLIIRKKIRIEAKREVNAVVPNPSGLTELPYTKDDSGGGFTSAQSRISPSGRAACWG